MFDSEEYRVIRLLIESNKEKVKGNAELTQTLNNILSKIEYVSEITLPVNITREEITTVNTLTSSIEEKIKQYTNLPSGGNMLELESIKKQITSEMSTLSSYRDKFAYEVEFLDDVFKKEVFAQLVREISTRDGISIPQAEKVVPNEEKYKKLKRDLHNLKIVIGNLKTKYMFFEKVLQIIIQSVSVASKELHNSRLDS